MSRSNLKQFDYRKVAKADTNMWRAYYNHRFLKMFFHLLKLMRSQLGLNWFITLRLAYYSGLAAMNYRLKKGRENYSGVLKNLTKFYRLLSKHSMEPFDYKKAAELELEWWNIHRYPSKYKKTLQQSLAEGMAVVYKVKPESLSEYAHHRAVAMMIPNHEGDKQVTPPDWAKVETLLLKSWQSLHEAVQKP